MVHLRNSLNKKLSYDDLVFINELLKANLPIKSCFDLIINSSNEKTINLIINKLNNGKLIEEIINDYLPKEISNYSKHLLKTLSFQASLDLSLSYYKSNKDNLNALIKAISYPLILLFLSLTAVYLFDSYGLDSIVSLMKSFNVELTSLPFIRLLIRILVYIFYFSFIIISLLTLYFIKDKNIVMFYILLTKYFDNSLLKIYFTSDFISLYINTVKLGYKTKDTLMILKSIKNKPLVSFLAFHFDELLLKGTSLSNAAKQKYYDKTLAKFINIASYSNNFIGILENYVELSKNKIKSSMKRLTIILQALSYVAIGIVIIFIYQILFLPMQAISLI